MLLALLIIRDPRGALCSLRLKPVDCHSEYNFEKSNNLADLTVEGRIVLIFTFLDRMLEDWSSWTAFPEFNLLILFFFLILVSKFQLLQMIYVQFKHSPDSSFCSTKFVCGQIAVGLSREVSGEEVRMERISDTVLV